MYLYILGFIIIFSAIVQYRRWCSFLYYIDCGSSPVTTDWHFIDIATLPLFDLGFFFICVTLCPSTIFFSVLYGRVLLTIRPPHSRLYFVGSVLCFTIKVSGTYMKFVIRCVFFVYVYGILPVFLWASDNFFFVHAWRVHCTS